jgi:hypothetical protein|tara:strand:- start:193 stop:1233 length:1041 start_codon:yes stop_codon:yes gene_type:complete
MSNPYKKSTWRHKVVDKIIELNHRNGTSMKDMEKCWRKSDVRYVAVALKTAVKDSVLTKTRTKYFFNVSHHHDANQGSKAKKSKAATKKKQKTKKPATKKNTEKLLAPQEVLKTATYIEGTFVWIGDVFSTHMENFNFFFVFATNKGCFVVQHDSEQRFADGYGGTIQIPADPGFSDPDSGQPFTIPGTMQKPKWLEDQLKPYRSEVEIDPVAFVNSKLESSGSFSVQLLGRQPLRDVLEGFSNWGWGLNWAGLEDAFAEDFMEIAFPTEADQLLFHVLSFLEFDERSLKYDVNGLLSKNLEDDECNPRLLLSVGQGQTTSASLSMDDAQTRFESFVKTFQYIERF